MLQPSHLPREAGCRQILSLHLVQAVPLPLGLRDQVPAGRALVPSPERTAALSDLQPLALTPPPRSPPPRRAGILQRRSRGCMLTPSQPCLSFLFCKNRIKVALHGSGVPQAELANTQGALLGMRRSSHWEKGLEPQI